MCIVGHFKLVEEYDNAIKQVCTKCSAGTNDGIILPVKAGRRM